MVITRGQAKIQLTQEELGAAWLEYQQLLNKEEDTVRKEIIRKNLESQGLRSRIPTEHLESVLDAIVEQVRANETEYGSDPEYEMTERLEEILENVLISMDYLIDFGAKTSMTFSTAEEMAAMFQGDFDLYNVLTEEYVFRYNTDNAIAVYNISLEEAKELDEKSQGSGEYWGVYLGAGGTIYDNPFEYCKDKYNLTGWIDVTPKH